MTMQPVTTLAERYWEGDLAHQQACQTAWAPGLEFDDAVKGVREALALDEELAGITNELRERAGPAITRDLTRLVRDVDMWPDSAERIHAAAALRVIDSDAYIEAAEGLQPGVELPAVGIWAELED